MKIFMLLIFIITTSLFGKNVLILNAYRQSFVWTQAELKGITDTIKKSDLDIVYYIEDMNTKVFRPTPQREQNLLNYYEKKYQNIKFDAIVVSDDNAINFVRKYKNTPLFKDVKVFFCGINNLKLANQLDKNIYAGVFEQKDQIANYNIAKHIDKNLKIIYIVTDNTVTSKKIVAQYKKKLAKIPENLILISNKNFSVVKNKLKHYEKHSVMFLMVFSSFFDKNGKISSTKVIQEISEIYTNPIIIHANPFVELPHSNIIGGKCTDGYEHGVIAAHKMIAYFKGNKIADIGYEFDHGNKYYLNMKNMAKFNLTPDDLGIKDFVAVNDNFSFYERNKVYINLFIFVVFIVIVFAILLVIKNKRLKEAAQTFDNIFDNTMELNILSDKGIILRVNEYGMNILGYTTKDDIIGRSIFDFINEQHHQKVFNAMQYEKSSPYELSLKKKDGTYRSFVNTSLTIKQDGKTLRFSSLVDVTEIKEKDKLLFQQSKLASMGEMIGNIAHQWRQPLSVITSGVTGIMMKNEYGILDDKFLKNTCESIERNAQYLSKTIDDFRNFIRGDRAKNLFSLKENFDSFVNLVAPSVKAYDIKLILDIEDIMVNGYANELLQCYINIFNNSKDVLKENNQENKYVFVKAFKENENIKIIFKDNGVE